MLGHSNLALNESVFSMKNDLVIADNEIVENSNKTSSATNNHDIDRFAELLASLIEKYADQLDLDSLPCPPRPTDE